MPLFKFRTRNVPEAPVAPIAPAVLAAPIAPAATASEADAGLSEPRILGNRKAYGKLIDKGEFFIIKYDGNDKNRSIQLLMQENLILPVDENPVKKSKDPKNLPWDVVVIMTAKWLLVARPQPQRTEENASNQAEYIWQKVDELLKGDREIGPIVCWLLVPNHEEDFNSKLHTDVHPIEAEERAKTYFKVFKSCAEQTDQLDDWIIRREYYDFGGRSPGPEDQTVSYRSQIIIHDHSTFKSVAEYWQLKNMTEYESYLISDHNRLEFPLVSLMAQFSQWRLFNPENVVTDKENSCVVCPDSRALSGWGNRVVDSEQYVKLMTNVFDSVPDVRLHQVGMPASWQAKAVQRRGTRSTAITQGGDASMDSLELEEADLFGCWKVPVDWTIPHEDVDELDIAKHRSEDDDLVLHGRQPDWEHLYLEAGVEADGHGHMSSETVVREPPVHNWYGSVARGAVPEATVDIHRDYEKGSGFPDP